MPYSGASDPDLPANVQKLPSKKKAQWVAVFNASHASCIKKGGTAKSCESSSFAQAWGVVNKREVEMNRSIKSVKSWSGGSNSYKTADSYCSACLIDVNPSGKPKTKSLCKLPVREDGDGSGVYVDKAVFAAAVRFNQLKKPEGVSDGTWGSAVKEAANKLLSAYSQMDKEAPDVLYEAAGKSKPKKGRTMNWLTNLVDMLMNKPSQRAMSLDNLMQKVYKGLYELEDENDAYYSMARLMVDEKGLWVVINDHGTLYRTDLAISADGTVTLGEMIEVKEEYTPVKQNRVFVKRQADGTARFFAIAASAVLNRVNEIDSRKLFDNMVRHAEEAEYYPAIDIHHLGQIDPDTFEIGYADFLARVGVTYITSGILDESKVLGRKMVQKLESDEAKEWGCSIEYFPIEKETIELNLGDNGTIPVDVYTDGVNTRISFLPEQRAANWFTQVTLKE